ncbi:MAG: GAF domain-containing protein [Pseudomonadota bacterium]
MSDKTVDYKTILAQASALTVDEPDTLANLANLSAILFESLHSVNWAGFYLLRDEELVLGPFQGKSACVRIPVGRGVCGSAVANRRIERVDDVHQFDGHIACDAASLSEIVLPIYQNGEIAGVLDIDSPILARFTAEDEDGLIGFADLASEFISRDPRSIGL